MKILHVAHGWLPEGNGGIESYLRTVLHAQRAAGHDARLLCGSFVQWPEPGIEPLEIDGVPVWRLHRDDLYFDHWAKLCHPGVARLFDALLAEQRFDLVHVHQWIRLTCNLVELCGERGVPAVVTLHDLYTSCPRCFRVRPGDEACDRPLSVASCAGCVPRFGHESEREIEAGIELYRDQYQAELRLARAVLVASSATADMLAATTGLSRERLTLLPLAYEPRLPGGVPAPAPLPRAGEPFRFGYWGNVTSRKGAQVLLQAFSELCASGPPRPVALEVFGGIDTPELRAELERLGRGLPVTMHGRYEFEQVARAGLHMAVFPMLCFETYGFVLDESVELGLPCIATDLGAIPMRAGAAAMRVPPRDPEALANAMREVLARPALRDELAARLPARGPTPAEHLERLMAVYARARAGQVSQQPPLPAVRREEFLALQRESALARVCPEGGPR